MPRPIVMPGSRASSAAAARLERAELREAQRSARGNTQQADDTAAKVAADAEAKVAADMKAASDAKAAAEAKAAADAKQRRKAKAKVVSEAESEALAPTTTGKLPAKLRTEVAAASTTSEAKAAVPRGLSAEELAAATARYSTTADLRKLLTHDEERGGIPIRLLSARWLLTYFRRRAMRARGSSTGSGSSASTRRRLCRARRSSACSPSWRSALSSGRINLAASRSSTAAST